MDPWYKGKERGGNEGADKEKWNEGNRGQQPSRRSERYNKITYKEAGVSKVHAKGVCLCVEARTAMVGIRLDSFISESNRYGL
jgi:hypothetical protein